MIKKISLGLLGLGLILYAVFLAPPDQPDTLALIQNLSTGAWEGINPAIIALFNLMGIWPMAYAMLLGSERSQQSLPAWPFVVGSFFVGAFALIPYLALRKSNPAWAGTPSRLLSVLESRWTGIVITIAAIALLGFGITQGNWADFIHQWQTSRFIHVMSLDFCLLSLLFPVALRDDMARRNWLSEGRFWAISLVPLLGALVYLCIRPSVIQESVTSAV